MSDFFYPHNFTTIQTSQIATDFVITRTDSYTLRLTHIY